MLRHVTNQLTQGEDYNNFCSQAETIDTPTVLPASTPPNRNLSG